MTLFDDVRRAPSSRKGFRVLLPVALAAGLALTLAGCKSSAEKAEEYYQSGLNLLEQGDVDRAIVQFRNVFDVEGTHYEARKSLAEALMTQGDTRGAYSQYLRLAEQYPDDLPVRIVLARMAFEGNQPQEFDRHAQRAVEIAPDDPEVRVLDMALRYREAMRTENEADRIRLGEEAAVLAESRPDDSLLLGMALDKAAREKDLGSADEVTEKLLELQPDNRLRYAQRLALLVEQGDMAAVEEHLRATIAQFPEDQPAKRDLISFLMSQNQPDKAEAYLRELAAAAPADQPGPRVDLLRFIEIQQGTQAAREELGRIIADGGDPLLFGSMLAGFDFRDGKTAEAIAAVRRLLENVTEPSDLSRDVQVQLARMLLATGDEPGANQQADEVLAQNAAHIGALKLRAGRDIRADRTDEAILSLRSVLDAAADDAEAMGLMAEAYHRAGEPELARDYLAQAATASGHAPAESLRLAQAMVEDQRWRPAEDALVAGLRVSPDNADMLMLLGRVYLAMPDLPRAEGVITRLRELDDPRAKTMADQLELNRLAGQDGRDAALGYLEQLAGQADSGLGPRLDLLRARLSSGDVEGAREMARSMAEEAPGSPPVEMALAMTDAAGGDLDAARTRLRQLIEADPQNLPAYMALIRLAGFSGDREGVLALINEGLAAMPDNPDLLWSKAGLLEQQGDVDGTIAIYEQLYARNSSSLITANNLASTLATWRSDNPEAVARATAVARRLKDTDVPAFMDTYGWIQHLNGNSAEALPYLEGAAATLVGDPMVQIHLGLAQQAAGKTDAAREQLQKALEMLPEGQEGASIAKAREVLSGLQSGEPEATDATGDVTTDAAATPAN